MSPSPVRLRLAIWRASWLALTLLQTAWAQPPVQQASTACLIVYGHARNSGDAADNAAWDLLNARFNEQVTGRLQRRGQAAEALLFKAGVTDVAEAVAGLIERARQRGCARVVDTAVFADDEAQTLVVRLRVHPLLGRAGPRAVPNAAWQIGEPIYATERELDLNQRSLARVNLAALAEQMVDGYLAEP